jgi:hypothetical protein
VYLRYTTVVDVVVVVLGVVRSVGIDFTLTVYLPCADNTECVSECYAALTECRVLELCRFCGLGNMNQSGNWPSEHSTRAITPVSRAGRAVGRGGYQLPSFLPPDLV